MRGRVLCVVGAMVLLGGCGKYEPAPMPSKPAAPQAAAQSQPAPASAPAPSPAPQSGMTLGMQGIGTAVGMAPLETAVSGPMGVAPASRPNLPASSPPAPQPPPQPPAVKADVGAGVKGRGYGPGIITTPVATYFAAKEQIAFRIQIPDAMRLYKAMNGHAPETHEEFMEKIIKENRIQLPELPPGHRYRYYPEQGELMVEHPAP